MQKFAVFDIDGTLIRWQLYHVIVDRLAKNNLLSGDASKRLGSARLVWKKRVHDNAFSEYEMELIKIFESSLKNLKAADFDNLIHEVITEYKEQVYVYTRDLAKKLKQKDYFLLTISGSHQELVEEIAKFYKFDDWVGTSYERENVFFSGKSHIASHYKKELLSKMIKKHNLTLEDSYAIGDTASDAPMLNMVENPVAFNPNQELFQIAKGNGWPVVIERKNMVYQLSQNSGKYILKDQP